MADVPVGKQVNGFTGELEDAAPLNLAPSPTDQRKLSADTEDDRPLIDKVRERVEDDTARNVDGHTMPVTDTPREDITNKPDQQLVNVPATNTVLREEGHPVAPIEGEFIAEDDEEDEEPLDTEPELPTFVKSDK